MMGGKLKSVYDTPIDLRYEHFAKSRYDNPNRSNVILRHAKVFLDNSYNTQSYVQYFWKQEKASRYNPFHMMYIKHIIWNMEIL